MIITIPDNIVKESPDELVLEMAIYLYSKQLLTIGQARKLAKLDIISFQKQLANRRIPVHYTVAELEKDLLNLHMLK
jgi:predicted HTH domain antitoxin